MPAPQPAPGDTAMAGKPLDERTVGGAVVGAVTGAVLSAQESDCAPSGSPAGAIVFGAAWGAIRAALKWDTSKDPPLPDTRDNGGEEGPYPFDGQNCERADHD